MLPRELRDTSESPGAASMPAERVKAEVASRKGQC